LPAASPEPAPSAAAGNSLDFSPSPPPPAAKAAAPAPAATADNSGMIEFDMGALSLDLPGDAAPSDASPATPAPAPAAAVKPAQAPAFTAAPAGGLAMDQDADSPLATKLALAEEFNAIGDADGARSLAEEVVAEASGD